jgi:hypothetical protein
MKVGYIGMALILFDDGRLALPFDKMSERRDQSEDFTYLSA